MRFSAFASPAQGRAVAPSRGPCCCISLNRVMARRVRGHPFVAWRLAVRRVRILSLTGHFAASDPAHTGRCRKTEAVSAHPARLTRCVVSHSRLWASRVLNDRPWPIEQVPLTFARGLPNHPGPPRLAQLMQAFGGVRQGILSGLEFRFRFWKRAESQEAFVNLRWVR